MRQSTSRSLDTSHGKPLDQTNIDHPLLEAFPPAQAGDSLTGGETSIWI